jgi:hypothetical protein
MKTIVKKLNARGGYIYLPKKYIGQEIVVNLPDEIKPEPIQIPTPIPIQSTIEGLDPAEEEFLKRYAGAALTVKQYLYNFAIKQFGFDRVQQLLNSKYTIEFVKK